MELFYGIPLLIVTDRNLTSYILGSNIFLEKDTLYEITENWIGNGLVTGPSSKWRKTRKIINPAFNIQQLEEYFKCFENPCKILIETLKNKVGNHGFDVFPYLSLCTLDMLCETIMGINIHAQETSDSEYVKNVHEIAAIILRRLFSPFKRHPVLYMFTKDYWKERKLVKKIRNFTKTVIDDRKKTKAAASSSEVSKPEKKTALLDLLLDAKYDDRQMTDQEIIDEIQTFLFAGHDTTATCVSLTLYCLSKHPDVQDKAVEELKTIFGKDGRSPTAKDLNDMLYLEMVIKETMRLYTPVPLISRLAHQDISYGDILIPKGMSIMFFIYGIHKNPMYHPNPDKFDPSRFEADITPFTYLPFSAGPRSCIGQRFGTMEIKYILCEILRTFKILPVAEHIPQQVVHIVLKFKNGVMIKLQPR